MDEVIERPVVREVCPRKKRRKRQKKLLKQLLQDYAKNTTLHGLRYTTENGLHIVEKVFWLITFTVSVVLSFYLISKVWTKWTTSPIIVSFAGKPVSVQEVPLPSITICPAVKFLQSKINFTKIQLDLRDANKTVDNETLANVNAINLICDAPFLMTRVLTTDSSMINRLINVSTDIVDILDMCFISIYDCEFKAVLTNDGLCYTYNGLSAQNILNLNSVQQEYRYSFMETKIKDWTLDKGYTGNKNDAYPRRGQDSGQKPLINIRLANLEDEKDKLCNAVFAGYKIYLHHPSEWPQAMSYYFVALPKQETSLAVKVNMVTTSKDLQSAALNVRQCYFQHERPLKYFKIYSYNHCRLECLTNYTYDTCQCVLFHMPFHDSTKVCSSFQTSCAMQANFKFGKKGSDLLEKCKCLPACNYIQYDAEFLKTDYEVEDLEEDNARERRRHHAKLKLFFKEPIFTGLHRSELFGLTDFLGTCGGLLGLFLGFSFLSIVEIFYFITFRVYKKIKADIKSEKLDNPM
ncbi:hypothetical protein ABMA27_001121 [Loxostege sticticalis]|uniref:Uncharacterized protein n=1 Tax=Loxostege sticticalis TaxID=481309 RepID=A0ABR3I1L6_LOXSC